MINRRLVLSVSLCAGLVGGCASSASPSASSAPTALSTASTSPFVAPPPSASAPSTLPSEVDIDVAGALRIDASSSIDWAVVVGGRAWIAGLGAGIGVLDDSGKLQQSFEATGACESMDTGFGAVWSASCDPAGIIRIDAKTGALHRAEFDVPIPDSEASVGVGEGAVWVVAGGRADVLLEIDPKTLMVVHHYPIPAGGAGVRAGLGGVWVTMPSADQLLHVDPSTGAIIATIGVGPAPRRRRRQRVGHEPDRRQGLQDRSQD